MTDRISQKKRSDVMRLVRGKNTSPERRLQRMIRTLGYRFSTHSSVLPGKPDIVLTALRKVLFLHGCFWHGHQNCKRAVRPASNVAFWNKKLDANIARDRRSLRLLRASHWRAKVVWECSLRANEENIKRAVQRFLKA